MVCNAPHDATLFVRAAQGRDTSGVVGAEAAPAARAGAGPADRPVGAVGAGLGDHGRRQGAHDSGATQGAGAHHGARARVDRTRDRGRAPAPKLVIDLEKMAQLPRDQAGPLARYVATIQSQRGDYNGRVLSIRQEDLRSLAVIYDKTPTDLTEELIGWGILDSTARGAVESA